MNTGTNTKVQQLHGVEILGPRTAAFDEILTPDALKFVVDLERRFGPRRRELLAARVKRQARLDAGERPDFLGETAEIRNSAWTVAPVPADLRNRRVEITGPVDRKMVINALNSGASVFMADFEDSITPSWVNVIEGQHNLRDAVRRTISYDDSKTGKSYALNSKIAVLLVRPRGWHLPEKHVVVDGAPMSGSLFDFGLFFWHNAKEQIARGTGPYFYLPKMESHLEARLWNEVFIYAQDTLGLKRGTIKGTVLIETILATFEMDEILYELREHSSGLNCGRWDYIFSFIKKFANDPTMVLPDRARVTMTTHFLRSYSKLLIKTCHRREVHAMGGMAAYIPNKNDAAANQQAMDQVRADKEREVGDGHDGTWVAHPDLVPVAAQVFDRLMPHPNQLDRRREDVQIGQTELLEVHDGTRTEAGLRENIRVGVQYIEAWLRGRGAVPLYNLMEDAATAEISRSQIWQELHFAAVLADGGKATKDLFERCLKEEMERVKGEIGADNYAAGRFPEAIELFRNLSTATALSPFLTLPAYRLIV